MAAAVAFPGFGVAMTNMRGAGQAIDKFPRRNRMGIAFGGTAYERALFASTISRSLVAGHSALCPTGDDVPGFVISAMFYERLPDRFFAAAGGPVVWDVAMWVPMFLEGLPANVPVSWQGVGAAALPPLKTDVHWTVPNVEAALAAHIGADSLLADNMAVARDAVATFIVAVSKRGKVSARKTRRVETQITDNVDRDSVRKFWNRFGKHMVPNNPHTWASIFRELQQAAVPVSQRIEITLQQARYSGLTAVQTIANAAAQYQFPFHLLEPAQWQMFVQDLAHARADPYLMFPGATGILGGNINQVAYGPIRSKAYMTIFYAASKLMQRLGGEQALGWLDNSDIRIPNKAKAQTWIQSFITAQDGANAAPANWNVIAKSTG